MPSVVPLVYFVATRPGWYEPMYPAYVVEDDPIGRTVLVAPVATGSALLDELEPVAIEDPIESGATRCAPRHASVCINGASGAMSLLAYKDSCGRSAGQRRHSSSTPLTSQPMPHPREKPKISNGLSLCSIHHRAFDQNLVGVSPDYLACMSRAGCSDDEDGPMLALLKTFSTQEP